MLILAFVFLAINLVRVQLQNIISVSNPNNITIAYGSCLSTFDEEADIELVMTSIIQTQPDLWMWLGDTIYLDGQNFFFGALPGSGYNTNDVTFIQNTFDSLKNNADYLALRNKMPNDADGTFEYKERNKGFNLDFLDEPKNSIRRKQPGVYDSYYIGEDKLIKVILLDIRYNKAPEPVVTSLFNADVNTHFDDLLGEEQWIWLEAELQDPNGTYTLIASSVQFLPDDRPILPNWYRGSLNRLLDLINKYQKSGVVFLSGDVHFAEMTKHPCPARIGYKNVYEFTSSGLTHSASFLDVFDELFTTFSAPEDRFFYKNFAVLKFMKNENSTDPPNLMFETRDAQGKVVMTREVPYSDLVYDAALASSYNGCGETSSDFDYEESTVQEVIDASIDLIDNVFSEKKN